MKSNLGKSALGKSLIFLTYFVVATGIIVNARKAKAYNINLNYLGEDPNALAGFEAAASIWESKLQDPITVQLQVDFRSLGSGILGQNSSQTLGFTYSQIENALIADRTSSDDAMATANLPGFGSISTGSGTSKMFTFVSTEDNNTLELIDGYDGSTLTPTADNVFLDITRANAKALGLLDAHNTSNDASITFSSDFAFDLDRSDGISAGEFDFIGVALHEIGHALGFSSGVDIVDANADGQFSSVFDLDGFRVFNVLDLYRHSDLSVAVSEDTSFPVLDLSVTGKATGVNDTVNYDGIDYSAEPYLSIDGGANELFTDDEEGFFSTGRFLGDGQQASHWKDNLGIGLLDPTISPGVQGDLTNSDLRAFDVIGYNLVSAVPFEFSPSLGLLLIGFTWSFTYFRPK